MKKFGCCSNREIDREKNVKVGKFVEKEIDKGSRNRCRNRSRNRRVCFFCDDFGVFFFLV